jgi:hypothetical protein
MGSWITGRFTADATSQQFNITANASAQLNLLQVRDITVVPEPSAALLACLASIPFLRRRRA